jgi:hypothetical protein
LLRAYHADKPSHHVFFDVTMEQEVAAERDLAHILRWTLLQLLEFTWQTQGTRHFGVDHERFDWTYSGFHSDET